MYWQADQNSIIDFFFSFFLPENLYILTHLSALNAMLGDFRVKIHQQF